MGKGVLKLKTVNIKGLTIGEGSPRIIVPIVEKTRGAIVKKAKSFNGLN